MLVMRFCVEAVHPLAIWYGYEKRQAEGITKTNIGDLMEKKMVYCSKPAI